MMSTIVSLYERFSVLPTCTDSELRKAYRDLLFVTHPDRNPQDHDATGKTQSLTEAYAELKRHRAQPGSDDQPFVAVSFSFSSAVDIEKVASIKARLRAGWDALQQQPSDPLSALRFIHAAFEAEQEKSDLVMRLLADPLLIDLAPTLLSETTASEQDLARISHRVVAGVGFSGVAGRRLGFW
jgi:curved DNA-binding protein CbpA